MIEVDKPNYGGKISTLHKTEKKNSFTYCFMIFCHQKLFLVLANLMQALFNIQKTLEHVNLPTALGVGS